jgi:tetratricopeptide (TPR) repeat protein
MLKPPHKSFLIPSWFVFFFCSQIHALSGPQSSAIQLSDAEKLVRQGKHAEAEASLRALVARQPAADGFHLLGFIYEQRNSLDQAETAYKQALKLEAGRDSSKGRLGIVYGKKGKYVECIAVLEGLQDSTLNNPETLFYLCRAYLESGNQPKALEMAAMIERWEEEDPGALLSVGRLLASKNLNEQAVTILKKAAHRMADSPEAYYSLAYALSRLRRLEEASTYLDQARALDPSSSKILLLQALVLLDGRKIPQAKDAIRKAQALGPDDKFAAYLWSRVLIEEGAYKEAIKQISDLIAGGFQDPNAHLSLITAYRRNGELQKALSHALKMAEIFPKNPSAHLRAGIELEFLGEYQEAQKYLKNAITFGRDDPEVLTVAQFTLATISAKEGNDTEAARLLEDVIRANPRDVQARVELADIHQKNGKDDAAVKTLGEALAFDAQNKRAHFLLAKVLTKLGKTGEAEQHFKTFQELEKAASGTQSERPAIDSQNVK